MTKAAHQKAPLLHSSTHTAFKLLALTCPRRAEAASEAISSAVVVAMLMFHKRSGVSLACPSAATAASPGPSCAFMHQLLLRTLMHVFAHASLVTSSRIMACNVFVAGPLKVDSCTAWRRFVSLCWAQQLPKLKLLYLIVE